MDEYERIRRNQTVDVYEATNEPKKRTGRLRWSLVSSDPRSNYLPSGARPAAGGAGDLTERSSACGVRAKPAGDRRSLAARSQGGAEPREPRKPLTSEQEKEEPKKTVYIPPYNSDIRNLQFIEEADIPRELLHGLTNPNSILYRNVTQAIPENFSWGIPTEADSPEVLQKKSMIDGVRDQYLCGSCYAVTLAQILSDCHVVSGAVSWAPNVSATSIMACFMNNKPCNGGNLAQLSNLLSISGAMDQTCIDYSWCSQDKQWCTNRRGKNEFNVGYLDKLNANVPTTCGCYFKTHPKYKYKFDAPGQLVHNGGRFRPVYKTMVKRHILKYGPVIGSFAIYSNFNKFLIYGSNINGGVYFENGNYTSGMNRMAWNTMAGNINGFHAFSVMGWGVAKNIEYEDGKFGDVPYWHCRNSYGRYAGNEGYFKLAMYPFNMAGGQIDSLFSVGQTRGLGGIILLKCTSPPIEFRPNEISEEKLKAIKRAQEDAYYKAGPMKVREIFDIEDIPSKLEWWMIIVVLVILMVIATLSSGRATKASEGR
ncbi:papain-like proteinase [carnivorous sponge associated iridovirus]|nr:papain-like proteinase [carnivorous sponge associated iridovirus]